MFNLILDTISPGIIISTNTIIIMNNHNHILLHSTERGCVTKCTCCNEIQLTFGNIFTWMKVDNFILFVDGLNEINEDYCQPNFREDKLGRVFQNTLVENMKLMFSKDELTEFLALVNMACLSIQASKIITPE